MNSALVIGGASGIGLAVALEFAKQCNNVVIADRNQPQLDLPHNIKTIKVDLLYTDFQWLKDYKDFDALFYSAGFGRVAPFECLSDKEIQNLFTVNTIAVFKVLNYFMTNLKSEKTFLCGVMVSIAGRIASPLFSIYSASKAALFRGIEAINTELNMTGSENRVLEISPGSLKGTSFNGGNTDLTKLQELASSIIKQLKEHKTLMIPEYEEVYKDVIERYNSNPSLFAKESYYYKIKGNRLQLKSPIKIGYLSGTFDLFHIGHLNLIKRAKEQCDYLVVGVHKDASHKGKQTFISFEERIRIVGSLKYVDRVIESEKEDSDVYAKGIVKYDKLFVGSDYKGSDRFNRYETYFADKGVEIVYFSYTPGTSSTQLREALLK